MPPRHSLPAGVCGNICSLNSYDSIGRSYADTRRQDLRISRLILESVGSCLSVLNVGAGTGSYEPRDRFVVALDLSAVMIRQRPVQAAQAIQADALQLPFRAGAFEASLAILTVHHWDDWELGVRELDRVASKRIVILTWCPPQEPFWLYRYFPELAVFDMNKFPSADEVREVLGPVTVMPVPIPHDCTDGFMGAFWRRPGAYLDERVRRGISSFHHIENIREGVTALRDALENGSWQRDFGSLLSLEELDLGYRILVHDQV